MTRFLILLAALLFFQTLSAQYSSTDKKAVKLYQEADVYIKQRNFDKAKELLESAVHKDPAFVEAHLRLAGIYKLYADGDNARVHFEKACELKPDSRDLAGAYYIVGEYYFNDGNYEKAGEYFGRTLKVNPADKKLVANAQSNLEKVAFGIEAKKHPVSFKPVPLSDTINRFYINAYPVLTADQQTLIYYKTDGASRTDDGDIMISAKKNGRWMPPVSISDKINTQFDEGTCTMSADGKVLVFSSCNRPDGLGSCDLYISYRNGDEWSKPVNMGPTVNTSAWDSEASLSADGKTLYFASERKGGVGQEDIWMTRQNDKGEWMQAVNAGKTVNTPGREVSPFIHADGQTLYFCSNHHPGMGQFDIFVTSRQDSSWSAPRNLGYPINTHLNDVTIFITADNKKGFYVIYEKQGMKLGQCKIYEFEAPREIVSPNISTYAKGNVYDAETKQKLEAKIELIDLKTNKVIQSVSSDPKNGNYLVVLTQGQEYALYVQKDGYLFKSVFFDFKNPKDFNPLTLDVYLDPAKTGKSVVLNNIFFASNSYSLEDKSRTELDKIVFFLQKNPKLNIEFGGHTDDVGSDKDNLELSLKRAKSVYEYITGKGIPAARLKYKGYGETQPMLPNNSQENRQQNRRIEFRIL